MTCIVEPNFSEKKIFVMLKKSTTTHKKKDTMYTCFHVADTQNLVSQWHEIIIIVYGCIVLINNWLSFYLYDICFHYQVFRK